MQRMASENRPKPQTLTDILQRIFSLPPGKREDRLMIFLSILNRRLTSEQLSEIKREVLNLEHVIGARGVTRIDELMEGQLALRALGFIKEPR